ncbi:MAG TPA: tRNA (adenosine(37)-N6)-threonylcarbamoyltransferase complex ATPase subunit type 1 TsaE [Candidatus Saccharimonadia bacterium]|nr:tRNA (adenosine(37)-N6)-threonylcarbamoyltransferase complex ATPase subunit type 1 TsaE [Candidatus Saccharimonadia bacterium]
MSAHAWHAPDERATREIGAALARVLEPGLVIHLEGELGAGKTTLARALIQALVPSARVKSPTYTLIESYDDTTPPIHHLDLYRIAEAGELEFLGLRELVDGGAVLLVEWPRHGGSRVPPPDLAIQLVAGRAGREIGGVAASERGRRLLEALAARLAAIRTESPEA